MSGPVKVCVRMHMFTNTGRVEEVPLPHNRNYKHIDINSSATFTSCVLYTPDNRIIYRFIGIRPRNELTIDFGNKYLECQDVLMKMEINCRVGSRVDVMFMMENSSLDTAVLKYCIDNDVDIDVPMAKIMLTERPTNTIISIPPLGKLSYIVIYCNEKFTKLSGVVHNTSIETNIMLVDVSTYEIGKKMHIKTDIPNGTTYYVYLIGSYELAAL